MSTNTIEHQARLHATLSSVGFIILLPIGIIIPRYLRTFTNKWFYFHVAFQFLVAGPVIMAGFAMGYHAVQNTIKSGVGITNFYDRHMKIGLTLFVLYFVQLTFGLAAHLVKGPTHRVMLHRSPQRLLHIALGLAIIGLAFYNTNLGYQTEWITYIATIPPASVNKAWKGLVIALPVLYVIGYALYPRQLSQEAAKRAELRNGFASKGDA